MRTKTRKFLNAFVEAKERHVLPLASLKELYNIICCLKIEQKSYPTINKDVADFCKPFFTVKEQGNGYIIKVTL